MKLLPRRSHCRLLANDARPLLVHRELGPVSNLPVTRAQFDAALAAHPRLCVAVVGKAADLDPGKHARRARKKSHRGIPLLESLVQDGRLELTAERPNFRLYEAVNGPTPLRLSARE